MHIPFTLRPMMESDRNFIFNSFLKSYHQNSSLRVVPNTIYYKGQADIISYLLEHAQVSVACFPEDPTEVIGYIIYQYVNEDCIIHYLYIKEMHRKQKCASEMIQHLSKTNFVIVTHLTDNFATLRHRFSPKRFTYDPFFITNQRIHVHS